MTLAEIAQEINPTVRGWIGYYGRFYPSELSRSLRHIDAYLIRWVTQKYKRMRRRTSRAAELLASVARREPGLFAHWHVGGLPSTG